MEALRSRAGADLLILLVATGCDEPPDPRRATEAFHQASAGDASGCDSLSTELRGFCHYSAALARGADCDVVPAGQWRDECTFEQADRLSLVDAAAAAARCEAAGAFRADCARHVATQAGRLGTLTPALLARLAALAPELASAGPTGAAHLAGADAATHVGRISPALCRADDDACLRGAAGTLERRWVRKAGEVPRLAEDLCEAGDLPSVSATARLNGLDWEHHPVLDEGVRRAKARVCGGR